MLDFGLSQDRHRSTRLFTSSAPTTSDPNWQIRPLILMSNQPLKNQFSPSVLNDSAPHILQLAPKLSRFGLFLYKIQTVFVGKQLSMSLKLKTNQVLCCLLLNVFCWVHIITRGSNIKKTNVVRIGTDSDHAHWVFIKEINQSEVP